MDKRVRRLNIGGSCYRMHPNNVWDLKKKTVSKVDRRMDFFRPHTIAQFLIDIRINIICN
jgi:hypothetical protein